MMQNHGRIISDYRAADFNHRLDMYLQFPAHRSEFIDIDRNDLNLTPNLKLRKRSLAVQVSVLLSSMGSGVKKLLSTL